ncbi:MAG: hypothetical protein QOH39_2769 [Verrucomicrobiota bacterium]|jgi:hypothetical protein
MATVKASQLFNGPVEIGLRALMILAESHPGALDLQRLVILDYFSVHSADIDGGPPSLHPPGPLRAGEVSIRRGLLEDGLHLFATKGLVSRVVDVSGIRYRAEELAATFLDALSSDYANSLRDRAKWAVDTAGSLSDDEATALLDRTIGRWKTEFVFDEIEE